MRKLTVLLCCLVSYCYTNGQNLQAAGPRIGADSTTNIYFTSLDQTLPIYNGRVFYGYPGILEHAFYPINGWQKGSVLFDGIWHHDMQIMYDIYQDEVIVLHPSSTPIRLISERVMEFTYDGSHFVRLLADKDNVLKTGFYQRLADGTVTIWVKRIKKVEENIVDLAIERKFISLNQYYAFKDGAYTTVYKQKPLLELMKDKRQGVVQHLKQQKLKFKKERERAIIQMAEFYNKPSN